MITTDYWDTFDYRETFLMSPGSYCRQFIQILTHPLTLQNLCQWYTMYTNKTINVYGWNSIVKIMKQWKLFRYATFRMSLSSLSPGVQWVYNLCTSF